MFLSTALGFLLATLGFAGAIFGFVGGAGGFDKGFDFRFDFGFDFGFDLLLLGAGPGLPLARWRRAFVTRDGMALSAEVGAELSESGFQVRDGEGRLSEGGESGEDLAEVVGFEISR